MIKQLWRRAKNRIFGHHYKITEKQLGGVSVKVYEGTIRDKADKDDAWFACLVKDAEVVFDIGANIGYTALISNVYGKPKAIVLVDPNPLALSSAAANMIMNDMSANCRFIPAFVSDKKGQKVKFYTIGRGAAGSIYPDHAKSASKMNSWYLVPTTTLDDLANSTNLHPDLVKIDVEGAEFDVLSGAQQISQNAKTSFMIEMHSNADLTMRRNAENILGWCEANHYSAWYLKEAALLTNADQIAHRGRCHLLLLPIGQPYPTILNGIKESSDLPSA